MFKLRGQDPLGYMPAIISATHHPTKEQMFLLRNSWSLIESEVGILAMRTATMSVVFGDRVVNFSDFLRSRRQIEVFTTSSRTGKFGNSLITRKSPFRFEIKSLVFGEVDANGLCDGDYFESEAIGFGVGGVALDDEETIVKVIDPKSDYMKPSGETQLLANLATARPDDYPDVLMVDLIMGLRNRFRQDWYH